VNLIAAVPGQVGAVASVSRLHKGDMRIGEELGAGLGGEANEGIVLGAEDQRGHGDPVHHAGAGGAVVVVVGIAEMPVASHNFAIEFTNAAHRPDLPASRINAGKELRLAGVAGH